MDCLKKWWTDAGCSLDGISSPENNEENVNWWNELSGQAVKNVMASYFKGATEPLALGGNDPEKCFG